MSFSKCDLITLANFSNGKNNEYVFSLISLPDAVRDIPSRGVVVAFLSCKLDVVPVITNTRKREREKKFIKNNAINNTDVNFDDRNYFGRAKTFILTFY